MLFTHDLEATAKFYRALGVPAESGHDTSAPEWRSGSSDFPGFYVESLDDTLMALDSLGTELLERHQTRPWGCRVVARDPDGRAIEINQREHCS